MRCRLQKYYSNQLLHADINFMSLNTYVVIMAGGSGERFWPLSRIKKPKQLLRLTSDSKSMIEEAIDRITPLVPLERILIITSKVLREPMMQALPNLPAANIIAEPAKRNTAPCLALATAIVRKRENDGDALMAVLAADHFIGDAEAFRADVSKALAYAEANDTLVTMGIPPTRPETGYGYIQIIRGAHDDKFAVHRVEQFREKPTSEVARTFLASGNYLWNSGMFFWRVSTLEAAMKLSLPDVGNAIATLTSSISGESADGMSGTAADGMSVTAADTEAVFASLPDISIDFGVMERAKNVAVVPASFAWDDVGSWDALDRMQSHDSFDNVVEGAVEMIDTAGSIICNAHSHPHIVTTLGLDDLVIVTTDDATLVCSKDRAQDVKAIVTALRSKGLTDVL